MSTKDLWVGKNPQVHVVLCQWRSKNASDSVLSAVNGGVVTSIYQDYVGTGKLDEQAAAIAAAQPDLVLSSYRVVWKDPVEGTDRYPRDVLVRPWRVEQETLNILSKRLPIWLTERGGAVIYVCGDFCSSHFGDLTVMPAKFVAEEDNQLHDAPMEHRPFGGLPSHRAQANDFIGPQDDWTKFFEALPPSQKKKEKKCLKREL